MNISAHLKKSYSLIIFLWMILTIINIDKAYHIDDAFHLEAANCINESPLQPMSGTINWENFPMPMRDFNQPPLFFYLIFFTQSLFGNGEIVMHLMLSVFTLISLLFFYKLTEIYSVNNKKLLLLLFAFCPAFIVNQNLMTDVPVLSVSLGTIYFLLKGLRYSKFKYYIFSAIFLSIGLLIKYSLVPLFLTFLITIVLSKNYKKLIVLLIPVVVLVLWSVWNLIEYDSVHFFDRPKSGLHPKKVLGFFSTLGSVSFFSATYFYYYFPKKVTKYLIYTFFVIFFLSVPLVYFNYISEKLFAVFLSVLFLGNGIILMGLIVAGILQKLKIDNFHYFGSYEFPIALYIIGFSSFVGLFAPFNATRHILLVIPFIILIGHNMFEKSAVINKLVLGTTVIMGLLLGVSDWVYADFYRKNASKIEIVEDNVWSIGHWGWQWYSQKAGMKIYSTQDSLKVKRGDMIVFPNDIHKQELSSLIKIDTVNYITETPSFLTFFSGKQYASMYISSITKTAWSLSKIPIDTIYICKVTEGIEVDDEK